MYDGGRGVVWYQELAGVQSRPDTPLTNKRRHHIDLGRRRPSLAVLEERGT